MDVKAPLDHRYGRACGVEADLVAIGASIDLLGASGIEHEFRTTVVPEIHEPQDIVAIARRLGESETLVLQQFAPVECLDPTFLDVRPYTRDAVRAMAAAAREFVAHCHVRGEPTSPAGAEASRCEAQR
jgi:pyruvate formate lyase activating enzyme